MPTVVRRSVTL